MQQLIWTFSDQQPQPLLLPQPQKMIRSAMMMSHTHLSSKILQRQLFIIYLRGIHGRHCVPLGEISCRPPVGRLRSLLLYYVEACILLLQFFSDYTRVLIRRYTAYILNVFTAFQASCVCIQGMLLPQARCRLGYPSRRRRNGRTPLRGRLILQHHSRRHRSSTRCLRPR